MKKVELVDFTLPTYHDYGLFKVKGLEKTSFRFELLANNIAVLDSSMFIQDELEVERHKTLSKTSPLYKSLQRSLTEKIGEYRTKNLL